MVIYMTDFEKNEAAKRKQATMHKLLPSLRKLFGPSLTPEDEAKLLHNLETTSPSDSSQTTPAEQKKEKPREM